MTETTTQTELDALRDRLAGLCGWEATTKFGPTIWRKYDDDPDKCETIESHPFPPNSIDAIAAVWPEGWCIGIEQDNDGRWYVDASRDGELLDPVFVAPTEYEARLRLTIAVLEANG